MSDRSITPPGAGEYAPSHAGYIDAVRDTDDLVGLLRRQVAMLHAGCDGLSDQEALGRYEPGKWSVKESVGHIADTERVFAYRLLRVARGDATPLPPFDQDAYVPPAEFDRRPLPELLAELETVRRATLALVEGLPPGWTDRRGTVSGAPVSARALAYAIAGHFQHHLRLFRDRYRLPVEL